MNWTGGRLYRYSKVTRCGKLKEKPRKGVHCTAAGSLRNRQWPGTEQRKGFGETDKAVRISCRNPASDARPATALPSGGTISDDQNKRRWRWAKARSVCTIGSSSSVSYEFERNGEGASQRKRRGVLEMPWRGSTSIDTLSDEESEEELDLSDEEVLQFTKRQKKLPAIGLRTSCPRESSYQYRGEGNPCRRLPDSDSRSRPSSQCHDRAMNISNALDSTLQITSGTGCMINGVIGDRLNDVSPTGARDQMVDTAQLQELRNKLLGIDDWAMLRLSKPFRWKRKSRNRRY